MDQTLASSWLLFPPTEHLDRPRLRHLHHSHAARQAVKHKDQGAMSTTSLRRHRQSTAQTGPTRAEIIPSRPAMTFRNSLVPIMSSSAQSLRSKSGSLAI